MPTDLQYSEIPESEFVHLLSEVEALQELMNTDVLGDAYRQLGLTVITDPFDPSIISPVLDALRDGQPYSLVRLGDGEMNFFTFGTDPATPMLDRFALEQSVYRRNDRFRPNEAWRVRLRTMMVEAVKEADAVGVIGLWRALPASAPMMKDHTFRTLRSDPRGISGHWRGIAKMLAFARTGALEGKLICPAHSYFGLSRHLSPLVRAADRVLCLTNQHDAVEQLRVLFPETAIAHLPLNATQTALEELPDEPDFLFAVKSQLEENLARHLVLIGAGPWAEYYAMWVRQRGGVALDFGSAFDLLAGIPSRPIHHRYLEDRGLEIADLFGGG